MSKGLFFTVMEAEGDEMQPFDAGAPADAPTADTPSEDIAPPATDNSGGGDALDSPPELSESGDDSMDFMGGGESDDNNGDDTGGGDTSGNEDDADKKDEKLADKANNILNERLYKQFVNRNNEIEEIVGNIKGLVPLLPIDVVRSNDQLLTNLKSALMEGQNYVINDFVDSGYGENLLKYQQLDSLYVTLLNQIDKNLKKIKK